jgi:hypothetical protein
VIQGGGDQELLEQALQLGALAASHGEQPLLLGDRQGRTTLLQGGQGPSNAVKGRRSSWAAVATSSSTRSWEDEVMLVGGGRRAGGLGAICSVAAGQSVAAAGWLAAAMT